MPNTATLMGHQTMAGAPKQHPLSMDVRRQLLQSTGAHKLRRRSTADVAHILRHRQTMTAVKEDEMMTDAMTTVRAATSHVRGGAIVVHHRATIPSPMMAPTPATTSDATVPLKTAMPKAKIRRLVSWRSFGPLKASAV